MFVLDRRYVDRDLRRRRPGHQVRGREVSFGPAHGRDHGDAASIGAG
jgi:hypothetical protein